MKTEYCLKSMRANKNMTQEQLAEMLGRSRQNYITIEKNPLNSELDDLLKIIALLEGNIDDFLYALKQDYMSYNDSKE